MLKEFIIMVLADTFRVYTIDNQDPIEVLKAECEYLMERTTKKQLWQHWSDIHTCLSSGDYICTQNFDFRSVRKIV